MHTKQDRKFITVAGIAALITAITTIGVHYVTFPTETFEDRLQLSQNNLYLAHRWMIILHCTCVIISMLGIALMKVRDNKGFVVLGMLFYSVFGITEIARMFAVLHYLTPLRQQYLAATDPVVQNALRHSIESFNLVGFTLFAIFAFAFMLGNLCYGVVLTASKGKDKWLGFGFLFWALISIAGMTNDFIQQDWIDKVIEINSKTFQPLFRLIIGIWLLRSARGFNTA